MSWAETVAGSALLASRSPLDSRRFGLAVSRVTVPVGATHVSVDELEAALLEQHADVAIVRYPARNTTWFAELMRHHEVLMADSLVYWRLRVGTGRKPTSGVSTSGEPSRDLVDSMIVDIFTGYSSHYAANPLFDDQAALAGYQEWAQQSIAKGNVLFLRVEDAAVGLATVEADGDLVEILLAGIVPDRQGEGLYAYLLAAVEQHAEAGGASSVVISTQAHNTNVQRAWARYGFEPMEALLTLHVMPSVSPRR